MTTKQIQGDLAIWTELSAEGGILGEYDVFQREARYGDMTLTLYAWVGCYSKPDTFWEWWIDGVDGSRLAEGGVGENLSCWEAQSVCEATAHGLLMEASE